MKPEYDFSKSSSGLIRSFLPIYLNPDIQAYLLEEAGQKGVSLGEIVNTLLAREMQTNESVK